MENSIEETIKIIERKIKEAEHYTDITGLYLTLDKELCNAFINILSEYKRVLKINEVLLKENEQLRREMNSLQKELILECEEKDKIIEQMTYYIMNLNIDEDICKKVNCDTNSGELDCKDCIKQYFENKAKEIK